MKKLLVLSMALLLFACAKNEQTAKVQFALTDAPGSFDAVLIDLQSISVIAEDEQFDVPVSRPGIYNLLDFTNGVDTLLADFDLPEGRMNQIRLTLGSNNSVVVEGDTFALLTPSAQQSGLKLNVQYDLLAGIDYRFVLDFDAQRSIVKQGNGRYLLKPVIRVFTTASTGAISGRVLPDSAAMYVMAISNGDTFGTIPPDSGTFLIKGMLAGTYKVVVQGVDTLGNITLNGVAVRVGEVTSLGDIQF